jgi:uncharacterized protein with FMN-binding domain
MTEHAPVGTNAPAARWQMPALARRSLLTIHVVLACVWLGGALAILLLQAMKDAVGPVERLVGIDRAIFLIFDRLIVNASYGFVVTGLAFSLFTAWGAWRYRWVTLKWIALVMLGVSLPLFVAPHVNSMTAISDAFRGRVAGTAAYAAHGRAVIGWMTLQSIVLIGLVAVSVLKPWGRRKERLVVPRWIGLATGALMLLALGANLWLQEVKLAGYRSMKIGAVDVGRLVDGIYEGRSEQDGVVFRVRVSVAAGRITRVDVLSNRDDAYAKAAALIAQKLADQPRNDIDAISGATTTSKALLLAVENALRNAPMSSTPR